MSESGEGEIAAVQISKNVYVHDPTLPRSARTNTTTVIVVTNRSHVRFEKLRIDNQYDYKMFVDAVEMLPATWQHAGIPPDGTFSSKPMRDPNDPLRDVYSDFEGFMILVMAACNLTMRKAALSYHGRPPPMAKVTVEWSGPPSPDREWVNHMPPITNTAMRDSLDEGRMTYVLDMLVRLFYQYDGKAGEQDCCEQELRKAVILYLSGTGGANQFTNFTSLLMSLELAVGFAKSMKVGPGDESHERAAALLDTIRWRGIDPAESESSLVKSCSEILDSVMTGRVYEYTKLNNRLKHYGRKTKDAKYFDNNVAKIQEVMRGLRVDAAYVILLGLTKLHGTESPPARASKASHTSQVILGMIEDCVDRRGADGVDGGVESKIRRLMDFIENDAIKSEKFTYDDFRLVLCICETLVKAARMLDTPGGLAGVRALTREFMDIVPEGWKPAKLGYDIEHDENELHAWLKFITHSVVIHMDSQFHHTHVILHVAQHGRTSGIECDPDIF